MFTEVFKEVLLAPECLDCQGNNYRSVELLSMLWIPLGNKETAWPIDSENLGSWVKLNGMQGERRRSQREVMELPLETDVLKLCW